MESFVWALKARDSFSIVWPILASGFVILALGQTDMAALLVAWYWRMATGDSDRFRRAAAGVRPTGMVIIPSLLRDEGDFEAITVTIESCAANGYSSDLVIIAAVDGVTEKPDLYSRLCAWVAEHGRAYPKNVKVFVGGTPTRLGKMMAVEAGVALMRALVAEGRYARFPEIYFSIDGDGTLSEDALERLAARLTTPNRFNGNMRRVVSGQIMIRPDLYSQGWNLKSLRSFFSIEGQIYRQVAREFVLSNVSRHNWKLKPRVGIPGALYATWSEVLVAAPPYMGFMKTLTLTQWIQWWAGFGPPRFSETTAPPCPEALTGASDDTCIAFLASIASWQNGKLCFDGPRTPLHAIGRVIRSCVWERSHDYDPEARVYTFTPSTLKALWTQRVRWNSSRFECAGRFWRAFGFHWEIGALVMSEIWLVLAQVFRLSAYYLLLPYLVLGTANGLLAYATGYMMQMVSYGLYTGLALLMDRDRKKSWTLMFSVPLAPLYCVGINAFGCVYGVFRDVFVFGASTKFAPEWTLRKGRTERVALLFRVRRALALAVRAVVVGDVPFGAFWFGWAETAWTPSGYDGWTTGKKPRAIIPPVSAWFRGPSAPTEEP